MDEKRNLPDCPAALQVQNLTKQFGDLTAVDGLSFTVLRNEIFGLLGPNGAGKTTTINMICGLLSPTSGSITYTGHHGNDYKSLIGYCPQENIIYPKLTCREQLYFLGRMYGVAPAALKVKTEELLVLLGLQDKMNARASNLSGGMKRRLNICLALIHNPEILILDEPEAGLDPQSRVLVRDFIKVCGREKTVILTTHNMDEADRLANRVAIIDHGKLLLLNTPQNLKKTVGDGDVLEMVVQEKTPDAISLLMKTMSGNSVIVKTDTGSILVKRQNIIEQLPAIKSMAESCGLVISEIKLRENTLEDVFIHLTGKSLRQ